MADEIAPRPTALRAQFDEAAHRLRGRVVSRDVNQDLASRLTFGDRLADRLAAFAGSWTFIVLFGTIIAGWMLVNQSMRGAFDPYPFILLNLVLSSLAAFQAPVIMMSQNRQALRDRIQAEHDYEINLKAESEVAALHAKFDELREHRWRELLDIQARQLALLEELVARLEHAEDDAG